MKFFLQAWGRTLLLLLLFVTCGANVFAAAKTNDGFYVGIDPAKTNDKIGNANNAISLDTKVDEDRYYGYKFSDQGFFVAPELFMQNGAKISSNHSDSSSSSTSSNSSSTTPGVTYDVKANLGYEFNRQVSGFVSYDLGSVAYGSGQVAVGANYLNSNVMGVGSQVNLSDDFGLKFSYSQRQSENSASGGTPVKSQAVKVGTVYSF